MVPNGFTIMGREVFDHFLFEIGNAGAYIPKGTPCTLHVSIPYVPLESGRNVFAQTPTVTENI